MTSVASIDLTLLKDAVLWKVLRVLVDTDMVKVVDELCIGSCGVQKSGSGKKAASIQAAALIEQVGLAAIVRLDALPANKLVKVLKVTHGLTTMELSEKLGVGYATLKKLESGGQCGTKLREKLAEVFELDASVFYDTVVAYNKRFLVKKVV